MKLAHINIGYAFTGSFCTFRESINQLKLLKEEGANIIPIFSVNAATINTRFGKADDFKREVEEICGRPIVLSIAEAEPLGPKGMIDILVIAPCTGNTMAKLCNGITDTAVLMAAKAHLRNNKPLVISLATNDALGLNLKNIGTLLNTKSIYFVPFGQDNHVTKPKSMIADVTKIVPTIEAALLGEQIQPILL